MIVLKVLAILLGGSIFAFFCWTTYELIKKWSELEFMEVYAKVLIKCAGLFIGGYLVYKGFTF